MLEFQVKMLKEELSLTDMLMCSTKTRMDMSFLSTMLLTTKESELSSQLTLTCLSSLSWDTSMAMLQQIQILYLFGKLNLVTLRMELRLSLINLFPQERPNGMLKMESSCFCLTVMTVMDQSIPPVELKDIFNCVTMTILFPIHN